MKHDGETRLSRTTDSMHVAQELFAAKCSSETCYAKQSLGLKSVSARGQRVGYQRMGEEEA